MTNFHFFHPVSSNPHRKPSVCRLNGLAVGRVKKTARKAAGQKSIFHRLIVNLLIIKEYLPIQLFALRDSVHLTLAPQRGFCLPCLHLDRVKTGMLFPLVFPISTGFFNNRQSKETP